MTIFLPQTPLPLLTAVLHLICHNIFQPPGFLHVVSMKKLHKKLLMFLTLTKHMEMIIYQFGWSSYAVSLLLCSCLFFFKIFIDTGTFLNIWKRMIPLYCNNNLSRHDIYLLGTRFDKIVQWILINSHQTTFLFLIMCLFCYPYFLEWLKSERFAISINLYYHCWLNLGIILILKMRFLKVLVI